MIEERLADRSMQAKYMVIEKFGFSLDVLAQAVTTI